MTVQETIPRLQGSRQATPKGSEGHVGPEALQVPEERGRPDPEISETLAQTGSPNSQ